MGSTITRRVVYLAEYRLLQGISALFRRISPAALYRIVDVLGGFAFHVIRIRRADTIRNIRRALGGDVSEAEVRRIARRCYTEIGMTFLEIFSLNISRVGDMMDVCEVRTLWRERSSDRGIVFVTGHLGSWEMFGAALAYAGIPLTAVARRQANPYVDAWITRIRELLGMTILNPGAPTRRLVQALRNGEALALVSDQNAGRRGVFVPFFGIPSSTARGAAGLALKYGVRIVFVAVVRIAPGEYHIFSEEIPIRDDDTVETLTARHTAVLEKYVRQYPEQYLWMHRRWKAHPDRASAEAPYLDIAETSGSMA